MISWGQKIQTRLHSLRIGDLELNLHVINGIAQYRRCMLRSALQWIKNNTTHWCKLFWHVGIEYDPRIPFWFYSNYKELPARVGWILILGYNNILYEGPPMTLLHKIYTDSILYGVRCIQNLKNTTQLNATCRRTPPSEKIGRRIRRRKGSPRHGGPRK